MAVLNHQTGFLNSQDRSYKNSIRQDIWNWLKTIQNENSDKDAETNRGASDAGNQNASINSGGGQATRTNAPVLGNSGGASGSSQHTRQSALSYLQ